MSSIFTGAIFKQAGTRLVFGTLLLVLAGCSGTKNVLPQANFPIPLVDKTPITMGIHLDPALREYVYTETVGKKGEWNVALGPVQVELFNNLAQGMFAEYTVVEGDAEPIGSVEGVDAVLRPSIAELQFALPEQTRSNYYEVWIRYNFQLFDANGTLISEWPLPAYGKANKNDFGNSNRGVEAAALAACRDAMAFFAINFDRDPAVKQWLDMRGTPDT